MAHDCESIHESVWANTSTRQISYKQKAWYIHFWLHLNGIHFGSVSLFRLVMNANDNILHRSLKGIRFGCVSLLWFWENRNNNTLDTRFIGIHFRAELPESHARISASPCLQSGHCGHPNVDQQVLLPETFEYIKDRWGISRKKKVAQRRGGWGVKHVRRRGGYGAIHHSLHSFLLLLIQFTACVPSLRQWNTHVRQLCWSLALYHSAPILGHPTNETKITSLPPESQDTM